MTTLDALAGLFQWLLTPLKARSQGPSGIVFLAGNAKRARRPWSLRQFIEVHPVLIIPRGARAAVERAVQKAALISTRRISGPGTFLARCRGRRGVRDGAAGRARERHRYAVFLTILWLALKSARLISAVFINLFVGLAITARSA